LNEDIPAHKSGAALYAGYLEGRISKAVLRRMFLGRDNFEFPKSLDPTPAAKHG
jgi:hypothetical protein